MSQKAIAIAAIHEFMQRLAALGCPPVCVLIEVDRESLRCTAGLESQQVRERFADAFYQQMDIERQKSLQPGATATLEPADARPLFTLPAPRRLRECPVCLGGGKVAHAQCEMCDGTGRVEA